MIIADDSGMGVGNNIFSIAKLTAKNALDFDELIGSQKRGFDFLYNGL